MPSIDETVLEPSRAERVLVAAGLPVLGGLAGWAVLALHDDWVRLSWVPMRGPAELVSRFLDWAGAWGPAALIGAGVLAGVVLVLVAVGEQVRLRVSADRVVVVRPGSTREHRAADVREVVVEGKELVLVGHDGGELARVRTDYPAARLAGAFRAHHYTWQGDR